MSAIAARLTPSPQLRSFVLIGLACTAAYALLYSMLRHSGMGAIAANAVSLTATMGANFAANRRYSFRASGGPLGTQLAGYVIAYLLGLAASSLALAILLGLLGHPTGAVDTFAAVFAGLAATGVRYVLMAGWVFRPETSPSESLVSERSWAISLRGVRPELVALVVLAAVLNLWALSKNGWANDYYAATVRSMASSWHNFLYDSFDPSGVMTVDKPPLALWVQALSVRVFGFHSLSVLVPQALMGVGSVVLVYDLTRRRFGRTAGFVAGLVLATTPMTVAISRHNNPDALLVLCCVAALWFLVRGLEDGRTRWLVLSGVAIGLGFETKMLVALMVLPGIALAWFWMAPRGRVAAVRQLLAGGLAMLAVGCAWPLLMTLTPASSRPWISGTSDNSIWSLIFGYNGLGRIDGQQGGPGGGGGGPGGGGGFFGGSTGPLRLFNNALGGQASWLLGVAVVGGIALIVLTRLRRSDARTGWLIATGGAFLTCAVAFSYAKGIFHPYYVSLLAPFTAALVGAAAGLALGRDHVARVVGPLAVAAGVVTELIVLNNLPGQFSWLPPVLIVGGLVLALALAAGTTARVRNAVLVAALALLMWAPATWAFDTLGHATQGTFPSGGPVSATPGFGGPGGGRGPGGGAFGGGRFGGPPGATQSGSGSAQGGPGSAQSGFPGAPPTGTQGGSTPGGSTQSGSGSSSAQGGFAQGGPGGGGMFGGSAGLSQAVTYVNAHGGGTIAISSQSGASAQIIASGAKVAGIGGFSGRESQVSVQWLAQQVASGKIRWVLVDGNGGGMQDGRIGSSEVMAAVAKVGKQVSYGGSGTLYDLQGQASALLSAL